MPSSDFATLVTHPCPLASVLAAEMRASSAELSRRWLERINARISLTPNRIFPTDELLDHVPLLVAGIADHIEREADTVTADSAVLEHAMELGALRLEQGFEEHEVLKEYEIFGAVLFAFLARVAGRLDEPCETSELVGCTQRLYSAISIIQQATMHQYVRQMRQRLAEREDRLRSFNRALTHEFRNRIGAALGAAQVLDVPALSMNEQEELRHVVLRNVAAMQDVLDNLLELSQLTNDTRQHRHVLLAQSAAEAVRQLREMARAHGVAVRVAPELPAVEVPAAAIELCLVNLVSNAIKYADPAESERWVLVRARPRRGEQETMAYLEVADNGIGVPSERRDSLFQRFSRAHADLYPTLPGSGLGLSIVRETMEAIGGTVWAEFPERGTVFVLGIPIRRAADRAASPA